MVFTKRLREGIRRGRITCSVRIWTHPHVKAGGRYQMDDGHIVVDSIERIRLADVTHDLAQESGFSSVKDLLQIAKHGKGNKVYLIRFHYLRPGAWDVRAAAPEPSLARGPASRESSESARLTAPRPSRAHAGRRKSFPTRRE